MSGMFAAIICARMDSTRMPGKHLIKIDGRTMLEHILLRLAKLNKRVVLATTRSSSEDQLAELAEMFGATVFRGSERNVLNRMILAAKSIEATNILRICGDNPLIDSKVIELTLDSFFESGADYAVMANLPAGISVEIIRTDALCKLQRLIIIQHPPGCDRDHLLEHATLGFHQEFTENEFRKEIIEAPCKWRKPYRLTVDEWDDMRLMRHIFAALGPNAGLDEVIGYLDKHPDIAKINSGVKQQATTGLEMT